VAHHHNPETHENVVALTRAMPSPTRRAAVPADLPAIVEIYNATIPSRTATADLEPVSVESRRAWFDAHREASRPLWVVEQAGQVAAWLSFSSFKERAAYTPSVEVSVYVRDSARRRGLGAYLVGEAIAYAPRVGVANLIGLVFGHNRPSLALFERFGFARWGVLPGVAVLDGIERDVVIVGLRV
jgi:phosphinothricin acetyltransferase